MKKMMFVFAAVTVCALFAAPAFTQGGKTSDTASKPVTKPTTNSKKPPATVTTKPKPVTRTADRGAVASLNGKWWTSGNDFGASEVILTQNGSSVTGEIHYADGRTGTVAGTMSGHRLQHTWSNSAGETGSGWLELSWNNFLGGPWHNQRVKNGSWTLMRVEGKWCFGGSRDRIRTVTHNAQGEMLTITEDGTRDSGRLDGPWVYLTSDDGMTIKGDMDFRANRLNWSSGFFWTWCGRN